MWHGACRHGNIPATLEHGQGVGSGALHHLTLPYPCHLKDRVESGMRLMAACMCAPSPPAQKTTTLSLTHAHVQVGQSKSSEYDVAAQKLQTEEMARRLDADLVQVSLAAPGRWSAGTASRSICPLKRLLACLRSITE